MHESHASEESRLRASRARLVAGADDERRRIERTLHDGIQQDLVALAVKLQLARLAADSDPKAALQLLDELEREVQDALDGVRALSATVYPASLETRGLGEALLGASSAAGVAARIDADTLSRYPIDIERAVYFACRSALVRTAVDGGRPTFRVWEEAGALCFQITEARELTEAEGQELRDRVDTLGGRVTISALAVEAAIPLS